MILEMIDLVVVVENKCALWHGYHVVLSDEKIVEKA